MLMISLFLTLTAAAVILIPIYSIMNRGLFRDLRKSILYFLFSLYLAAVYDLVGMPNITYIRFEINLNLIPFLGFFDGLKSSLLNILLFVPLGIGLPVLWQKFRALKNTVFFGFCLSLAIELLQMFTYRATDVNDLMTNTLGTFLGWLVANTAVNKLPFLRKLSCSEGREVYIVCGIVFLVMFFVQPFVFSILWNIVMH